jgi:hypothetical protein|tara:strand:+ start:6054 stop:6272 length:219 start_codon:yes stop_codon:yes gene_type:complete
MPETRYARVFIDGVEQSSEPYELSDNEIADETESKEITVTKLTQAIDDAFSAKQATVLKRVFGRLLKKGLLP